MARRWECPNGCPAVLGPERPRLDATCRVCLKCSAKSPRLVQRVCPANERRKSAGKERTRAKVAERRDSARDERSIAGVHMDLELRRIARLPVWEQARKAGIPLAFRDVRAALERCEVRISNRRYGWRTGAADTGTRRIIWINRPRLGDGAFSAKSTLLHEACHIVLREPVRSGKRRPHGREFHDLLQMAACAYFGLKWDSITAHFKSTDGRYAMDYAISAAWLESQRAGA
jgi:hypothetical protein